VFGGKYMECRIIFSLINNPRWRTAHCFQSKYFKNRGRYEKSVANIIDNFKVNVLSNETIKFFYAIVLSQNIVIPLDGVPLNL
jgi:hypothetical protein